MGEWAPGSVSGKTLACHSCSESEKVLVPISGRYVIPVGRVSSRGFFPETPSLLSPHCAKSPQDTSALAFLAKNPPIQHLLCCCGLLSAETKINNSRPSA